MLRIGIGSDVHRLVKGRELIIGGVKIPFDLGLLGHSDADVLIHAINDAILGALALGDIGKLFPDTDSRYKDISSIILMKHTAKLMRKKGYRVGNLDCVISCERPKLSPYIDEMRVNIANALQTKKNQVSVKATTTEGLGFEGKGEGIKADAVVILKRTKIGSEK